MSKSSFIELKTDMYLSSISKRKSDKGRRVNRTPRAKFKSDTRRIIDEELDMYLS